MSRKGGWLAGPQVLGVAAIVLSVCGLFVSIYQATLARQAQRASVWPHVVIAPSLKGESLRLWVQNTGVGPARIETAVARVDGETASGWNEVVSRLELPPEGGQESYRSLVGGRVLPAGSDVEGVLEISGAAWASGFWTAIMEGRVDIELCYCSVFEECWLTRLQTVAGRMRGAPGESARAVKRCEAVGSSGI